MFRVQKSDGLTEHRDGDDADTPTVEQNGSVTSSALRWLRGPAKPDDTAGAPRRRLAGASALARAKSAEQDNDADADHGDDADELELTEELELTMPLETEDPQTSSAPETEAQAQAQAATQPPAQEVKRTPVAPVATVAPVAKVAPSGAATQRVDLFEDALPLSAFDDDDDIDDFDDLGELEHMLQPARFEPAARASAIDLSELAPQRSIAPSPAPSEALNTAPKNLPNAVAAPSPRADVLISPPSSSGRTATDQATTDQAASTIDKAAQDAARSAGPASNLQPPVGEVRTNARQPQPDAAPSAAPSSDEDEPAEELPKISLRKATLEQHVPIDAPNGKKAKSGSTGLALQPIPELQSALRPSGNKASIKPPEPAKGALTGIKQATAADADDVLNLIAADPIDGPDIPPSKTDLPSIANLELVPEDADDEITISEDRPTSQDWHIDLADALSGIENDTPVDYDALSATPSPVSDTAIAMSQETAMDDPPLDLDNASNQVLPLSSTATELAVERQAGGGDGGEDVLVPPLSIKPQDRSAIPAALPTTTPTVVPVLPATLSAEQKALAIITQVPRLRRFAAAQIGDEQEADRLVGMTVQAVLADPTVLAQVEDQNLALLMMLCRRRQSDLSGAARPAGSASSPKAFLTTLCEKLIGADQFEIHQFAEAITLVDEEDRTLLLLAALEGLSYGQIATMVQRPVGQVMLRLAEARMGLRQALSVDEGKEPPSVEAHAREIEIHGYLDGELDQRHMADMDSLVEQDHDAADRLLHYGIQGDLIRRLYAPLLNRPLPQEMLAVFSPAFSAKSDSPLRRGLFRSARLALFAGAVVMVISAGIVTWMMPSLASAVSEAMTVSSPIPVRSSETGESQELAAATAFRR